MESVEVEEHNSHSEAVRDFIDRIPNWLIRWGITVIFLALMVGIFISWLIHYPTIVVSSFRLTSQNAPKPVIVKSDGRLTKLFVHDNQTVETGQILAYMESTANHDQVLRLLERLQILRQIVNINRYEQLNRFPANQFQQLGELQAAYEDFMQLYIQTLALFSNKYYDRRKLFLNQELSDLIKTQKQLSQQHNIYIDDEKIAQKELAIHKKLYISKDLSSLDYQREESKYISKRLPIKQTEVALTSNSIAQTQKRREIADLERQSIEQKYQFKQSINTLISALSNWKKQYLLEAPIAGNIHFSIVLQENQSLRAGTEVMYIGSVSNSRYLGELRIPQSNFGRVKKGQKVLVKFQGYPFEEYGTVEGIVNTISQIPSQDGTYFAAIVELPNGLQTTYSKNLIYRTGMEATGEIITEDLRLIERVFYQLVKVINNR